ncbi:hypothetical protein D1831_05975 [Lactiplantibacillus garii]|uniref:Uncharacterized protein n=1 Tax=Lactiplantibacillus garii TaxID=2306423 RepID=A0A3R8J7F1_9LACO|nr:hypothetical protein [Lactiplantibacillus garii]RRK10723.1 hypothetical protein D1831_05975 [Lactiplantibacillus garii]
MDRFTTFIAQLDQTLAAEPATTHELVYVPVTFSFHDQRLHVEINTLQTSFDQGDNAFGVQDILDRVRMLVGLELADRAHSHWPTKTTTRNLTITPHKVVRIIPVDMQRYHVE